MRFTTKLLPSRSGKLGILVLNNPKALHALTLDMMHCFNDVLTQWYSPEDTVQAVLLKSSNDTKKPVFCAGGDIKSIYESALDHKNSTHGIGYPGLETSDFFRREYCVNHMLATAPKPQISFWDGIVMGGGAGISMHGKYRVATENTIFAMPETGIGLFPDVGSMFWMTRLLSPGLAVYLALTGYRLKAEDLIFTGLATHFVTSKRLDELEDALVVATHSVTSTTSKVDVALLPILTSFHEMSYVDPSKSRLAQNKDIIEEIFGPSLIDKNLGVEDIISRLTEESSEFNTQTLESLRKMSPTSLKVTLEALRRGKNSEDLASDLKMEFRVMQACMRPGSDFYEGVRALLVDKDFAPKWSPRSLSEVTEDMVNSFFLPIDFEWDPLMK